MLVKRGVPLREWLKLEGARAWLEQKRRLAACMPPSKRVEYYIEATAAKLGLSRSTVEEALALYRGLERGVLVGKSPRVVAAAVIYAATRTPALPPPSPKRDPPPLEVVHEANDGSGQY